jgi:hypothetical protein
VRRESVDDKHELIIYLFWAQFLSLLFGDKIRSKHHETVESPKRQSPKETLVTVVTLVVTTDINNSIFTIKYGVFMLLEVYKNHCNNV